MVLWFGERVGGRYALENGLQLIVDSEIISVG